MMMMVRMMMMIRYQPLRIDQIRYQRWQYSPNGRVKYKNGFNITFSQILTHLLPATHNHHILSQYHAAFVLVSTSQSDTNYNADCKYVVMSTYYQRNDIHITLIYCVCTAFLCYPFYCMFITSIS